MEEFSIKKSKHTGGEEVDLCFANLHINSVGQTSASPQHVREEHVSMEFQESVIVVERASGGHRRFLHVKRMARMQHRRHADPVWPVVGVSDRSDCFSENAGVAGVVLPHPPQ